MALNKKQIHTLRLICQTFVPKIELSSNDLSHMADELSVDSSDFAKLLAHSSDFASPEAHLARRLDAASVTEQKSFSKFLRLIETPLACYVVTGFWRPFHKLSLKQRCQVLARWNRHPQEKLRRLFQSIKRLTMFLTYGKTNESDAGEPEREKAGSDKNPAANPSWAAFQYSGINPLVGTSQADLTCHISGLADSKGLECDVLIVGSGAGGGVAASVLAEAGIDCLVAEKGTLASQQQLGRGEYWGNRHLFEKHGSLSSDDLAIVVLSGATVGGGTTVNWMTSLEPAEVIRRQWANDFGWKAAADGELQASFDFVQERMNVNTSESVDNHQNAILRSGCERLGWSCRTIPRNATGCGDCGFCGYGCRVPGKQDTRVTFLQDAVARGARIVDGLTITKIDQHSGRVKGATARWFDSNRGTSREVNVKCKAVVCAGGAINTPALLLKSGFKHTQLGKNLFLHPTTAVASFHGLPITPWSGQPQTVVCDEFADLDGQGYGVRFETAPVHPGFGGLALAWESPLQHKILMSQLNRMANSIVLCRDQNSGQVVLDHTGSPRIKYSLGAKDAEMLLTGAAKVAEIHEAAGAKMIVGPHQEFAVWSKNPPKWLRDSQRVYSSVSELKAAIIQLGARPNHLSLFSAHQMSTCRISERTEDGPINLDGEFRGVTNLFVCDASLLPTSSGVNPMISIMGASHWVAQRICHKLKKIAWIDVRRCHTSDNPTRQRGY